MLKSSNSRVTLLRQIIARLETVEPEKYIAEQWDYCAFGHTKDLFGITEVSNGGWYSRATYEKVDELLPQEPWFPEILWSALGTVEDAIGRFKLYLTMYLLMEIIKRLESVEDYNPETWEKCAVGLCADLLGLQLTPKEDDFNIEPKEGSEEESNLRGYDLVAAALCVPLQTALDLFMCDGTKQETVERLEKYVESKK